MEAVGKSWDVNTFWS